MSTIIRMSAALLALVPLSTGVLAQQDSGTPAATPGTFTIGDLKPKDFTAPDFDVPQSPAFTALGVSADNATSPVQATKLALALLNGFDANGNFQNGLAIDTHPYLLFNGRNITLEDYRSSAGVRLFTNTRLSLATTKGTEDDDKSLRVAAGLYLQPWIHAGDDPRRNEQYLTCLARAVQPPPGPPPSPDNQEAVELYRSQELKRLQGAAGPCTKTHLPSLADPSAWSLSVAPSFISKDGTNDALRWNGLSLATTLNLRIGQGPFSSGNNANYGQVQVHAGYRLDEQVPDPAMTDGFDRQESTTLAFGYNLTRQGWKASVEAAQVWADRDGAASDSYTQYSAGASFRLADEIWLALTAGARTGQDTDDDSFANLSIKWNPGREKASR